MLSSKAWRAAVSSTLPSPFAPCLVASNQFERPGSQFSIGSSTPGVGVQQLAAGVRMASSSSGSTAAPAGDDTIMAVTSCPRRPSLLCLRADLCLRLGDPPRADEGGGAQDPCGARPPADTAASRRGAAGAAPALDLYFHAHVCKLQSGEGSSPATSPAAASYHAVR